ncbi:MAG: hypothetical protein EAY75_02360 [Bacteroidetes bacterium]|nr:MAG: hypothetical protein EAY75_02360 [Bacteroidota bacterium]
MNRLLHQACNFCMAYPFLPSSKSTEPFRYILCRMASGSMLFGTGGVSCTHCAIAEFLVTGKTRNNKKNFKASRFMFAEV